MTTKNNAQKFIFVYCDSNLPFLIAFASALEYVSIPFIVLKVPGYSHSTINLLQGGSNINQNFLYFIEPIKKYKIV